MSRPVAQDVAAVSAASSTSAFDGLETIEEANAYINNVIALSTLPAMWLGWSRERIGESLLDVLQTTLRPALSYIFVPAFPGVSDTPMELGYADGEPAALEQVQALGRAIRSWAAEHDPDDILALASPAGDRARICAYPLGHDAHGGVLAAGFHPDCHQKPPPTHLQRTLLNILANQAITAFRNVALQRQAQAAQAETQALYDVARALSAELDIQTILQTTTDAATRLTKAKFGAFFHNVIDDRGEAYLLYTISGACRESFDNLGMPRNTAMFDHTFRGHGPLRIDDVREDPRYGKMPPHHGMPRGHLPVCSYMAVPVLTRTGEVIGGLFFGHPDRGVFTEAAERIAVGIARHAAVALEMSRLFARSEAELAQRKRAEEELRSADRRKDEFLSTLAHELRNPLAPIRMAATILKSPGPHQKAMDILDRQIEHLVHLIDDLLDVSRISHGKIALRTQRIDLRSAIAQAVDGARALCEGRALELSVTMPDQQLLVEADAARVVQIVGNLLSNACKYTRDGGRIHVQADLEGDDAVVRVRDDGIGIAPEHLGRIFEMFAQVESATTRAPGGLGIGLSLARSLAEMHGGTLDGHSDGEGKGSEFVLRLRRVPDHALQTPDSSTGVARPEGASRRIIVVDDYPDALDAVTLLLEQRGHEVHTAATGHRALEVIESLRPHVVLVDIGLPDIDGYQVARRIRGWPWAKELVLVAMTGWGQESDKRRAKEAGFDAHLTKPADPDALEALLASI